MVDQTTHPPKCHSFVGLDRQIGSSPPAEKFEMQSSAIVQQKSSKWKGPVQVLHLLRWFTHTYSIIVFFRPEKPLHRAAVTRTNDFYTHRRLYTQKLFLHRKTFPHHACFYTFAQRNFYTEKLLHTNAFTQQACMQSTPKLWSQSAPEVEAYTVQASIIELLDKGQTFQATWQKNLPGLL